jgi:serine/threonine protein kinase
VWKIIAQLFVALKAMHHFNITHRDIKDDNIFIDENDDVKLGFFLFYFILLFVICVR